MAAARRLRVAAAFLPAVGAIASSDFYFDRRGRGHRKGDL
jgi:hypothetical protein